MPAIAVEGCVLVNDNPTAQAQIITPASMKVQAGGKGAYFGPLQVQVMGATSGDFVQTAPAVGTINPSAQKCASEGKNAVLEGDSSATSPAMCNLVNSVGVPMVLPVTTTIQMAGQTQAEAT